MPDIGKPRITYCPRGDATPETEAAALANIYRYIIDCHAKKQAAHPGGPDDAKGGSKHDFRADKAIIPESG